MEPGKLINDYGPCTDYLKPAADQGRVVPFFGNQGAAWGGNRFPVFSVVISDLVAAKCLENGPMEPCQRTRRHAWNALQYKLMAAATRWNKPVRPLIDVSALDTVPTSERLPPGEALSNGEVPMLIWSPHTWASERTYKTHAEYARFLNRHRALFPRRRPFARVALAYSVPTCVWRRFFFRPARNGRMGVLGRDSRRHSLAGGITRFRPRHTSGSRSAGEFPRHSWVESPGCPR